MYHDIAARHGGLERCGVEHVAPHQLDREARDPRHVAVCPDQTPRPDAVLEKQALGDPPADEPRRPGDQDHRSHGPSRRLAFA